MPFRTQANIDANSQKGLIASNSATFTALPLTGASLTNAKPLHVAIVDGSGNQVTSFGGQGGTSSSFGSAFPASGTAAGAIDASGNMAGLNLDGSGNLKVSGSLSVGGTTDNSAFTAGTTTGTPAMGFYHSTIDAVTDGRAAAIGITAKRAMLVTLQTSAGADTGVAASPLQVSLANTAANSTAVKVDGSAVTQPVSGTVTTTPPSNASTNIAQINAVTPLMGNGTTGTGSLRVTIASDNTAFSVNATLSAETTKVIGVTRSADGAGNLLTSNSTTYTAKFGLDGNLLGTLGTAFSTAGKVDIKGADGDVFVRQATGTNLHTVIDSGTVSTITNVVHIDDNSGSLTVDNGGTFAVQATVAAGATNIAKAEDVASADADVGVPALAVRKATPANTSGTDGDYEFLQMSAGRLWVDASGKTLTVDGSGVTQPVSGTVSITANSSVNVAQINGVTTLMGNGTTGTGSQRVTIASDNTAFSVNATLSAETTKVIGVVRNSDGAGNLWTSNSTTYTAKFAQDGNLLGTLGTAFSTAGKIDVKGADGDVFVRQATATNLKAQVVSGDATGSAVPANAFYSAALAQTALPAAASAGNLTGNLADKYGRQVVLPNAMRDLVGTQTTTITASTSETTIATAVASTFLDLVSVFISNTSATAVRVDIRDTTAGSVIFQLYVPAGDMRGLSLTTPWPQTTVNTNWTATSSASVTDLRISTHFVKNK